MHQPKVDAGHHDAPGRPRSDGTVVLSPPGQVTRVVVDFSGAQPGRYVWHCHILEHEDHEMMRPYDILSA